VNFIVYQNGYRLRPLKYFDEEIELINSGKIKPGLYFNKHLRISFVDEDTIEPKMMLTYKSETADQRMTFASFFVGAPGKTGLARIFNKVIAERESIELTNKEARKKQHREDFADEDQ
jgi:hypothetical protein